MKKLRIDILMYLDAISNGQILGTFGEVTSIDLHIQS